MSFLVGAFRSLTKSGHTMSRVALVPFMGAERTPLTGMIQWKRERKNPCRNEEKQEKSGQNSEKPPIFEKKGWFLDCLAIGLEGIAHKMLQIQVIFEEYHHIYRLIRMYEAVELERMFVFDNTP